MTIAESFPAQAEGCDAKTVRKACAVKATDSPRDRQFLFSLYSHTRRDYPGTCLHLLFRGPWAYKYSSEADVLRSCCYIA